MEEDGALAPANAQPPAFAPALDCGFAPVSSPRWIELFVVGMRS
jgi:hypothetical protein